MAEQGESYIVVEKSGSIMPFVWGALVGAVAMLLYAPRSGEETRRELRENLERLRERAEERLQDVQDSVSDRADDVRREVDAARHAYETGREVGGAALRETRSDVEQRVQDTRQDIERRARETGAAVKKEYQSRRAAGPAPESPPKPPATGGE